MAEQNGKAPGDVELLGRVVNAMALDSDDEQRDAVSRLRHACAKLLAIEIEEFPDYLQATWKDVRAELEEHGPEFENISQEQVDRLMALIAFVVGTLKRIAGL